MYISNMTHFLDETGNIPTDMPKEARELANFHALVVDETTKSNSPIVLTGLRCFRKKCERTITSEILPEENAIHWVCSNCVNEGVISSWQGTKWDNRCIEHLNLNINIK